MAVRYEPYEFEITHLHPKCQTILQDASWFEFFSKFQGYNMEVTRASAQTFDGESAQIGNLIIHLSENTLSHHYSSVREYIVSNY
jgi:hypothetical protein